MSRHTPSKRPRIPTWRANTASLAAATWRFNVVHLAHLQGIPATDPRIVRGLEWIKTHQRESGRWFTRSLKKDSRHYLTHAGTAFAIRALYDFGQGEPAK